MQTVRKSPFASSSSPNAPHSAIGGGFGSLPAQPPQAADSTQPSAPPMHMGGDLTTDFSAANLQWAPHPLAPAPYPPQTVVPPLGPPAGGGGAVEHLSFVGPTTTESMAGGTQPPQPSFSSLSSNAAPSVVRSPFAQPQQPQNRFSSGSRADRGVAGQGFSSSERPSDLSSPPSAASAAVSMAPQFLMNEMGAVFVASMAENVGMSSQDVAQIQAWFPQTVATLRRYFSVSHSYVGSKLLRIFFPFVSTFFRSRRRSTAELRAPKHTGSGGITVDANSSSQDKNQSRSQNDLYIPLMAFITYILLVGLTRGTFDDFHPALLSSTATFAAILLFLEVALARGGFYLLGGGGGHGSIPFLDVFALCGYKYVGLVMIVACGLFCKGRYDVAYWMAFVYFSFCTFLFTLSSLKKADPHSTAATEWGVRQSSPRPLVYFIWSISVAQVPLSWVLTPSWRHSTRS